MNCIFCKIAQRLMPTDLIFEDEDCIAFRDIAPQAPQHLLIIPKKHIHSLEHTDHEDQLLLGKLLLIAQKIARDLGHHEKGYRIVLNTGENGGQTVSHIHLHLLAGKSMTWPPG